MQSPFLWSTLMIVIHLKLAQQERSCYLRITPAITGTYHVILPPVYRSTSSLARTTCMHARIYACRYTHILYMCIYICTYKCVCVCVTVCLYIYTHRYVNIYICECVCVCRHKCVRTYVQPPTLTKHNTYPPSYTYVDLVLCIRIYIYRYIHMYAYI